MLEPVGMDRLVAATLQLNVESVTVQVVSAANYDSEEHPVRRHRYTKPEKEPF